MNLKRVDFNTAQLAQKKGFDSPTGFVFTKEGDLYDLNYYDGGDGCVRNSYIDDIYSTQEPMECTAPLQEHLKKWLRDEKELEVYIIPGHMYKNDNLLHTYTVWISNNPEGCGSRLPEKYDTYEKALEDGLKEALRLADEQDT